MFPSFGHLRTCWGSCQAYVQTCFILSCLPHVNNPAVFSCSTQVLEDILCDQRPTSGPLDVIPSGGDCCHSGLAAAMAPPVPTLASPLEHCPRALKCCAAPSTEQCQAPGRTLGGGGACGWSQLFCCLVMCVTFFDIRWGLFKILLFPMLHTGSGLASWYQRGSLHGWDVQPLSSTLVW